ncbi:MAG: hypothetical protein V4489_02215 [Chlamydiota bacterium]
MDIVYVGRSQVRLLENVSIQTTKKDVLAEKVLTAALVVITALGALLAVASGDAELAKILIFMGILLTFSEPSSQVVVNRVLPARTYYINSPSIPLNKYSYTLPELKLFPYSGHSF